MARKRTAHNKWGEGNYWYDKQKKRHVYELWHKGERYRATNRDKETARLRFEELKKKVLGGMNVEGSRELLRSYLPRYIDTEVAPHVKESTVHDSHKRADLYILPTFGAYRLCDIKRRMIVAWVTGMVNTPNEQGRYWSFHSIKQALGLLRRALGSTVPELLEYNPAADVKMPARRKGDEYQIDRAAMAELDLSEAAHQRMLDELWRTNALHGMYAYVVALSELGLRRGEGLGIRRKDIDFATQTITIAQQVIRDPVTNAKAITTPKTDSARRALPITDALAQLFREQCLRVGAMRPDDLLFPGKDGACRQPNSITQLIRRTAARLGLTGWTPHTFRHYRVTRWRTEGVDLEVVAALAGHKGVKVTAEVYSEATMERKRAALTKRKAE